jgi:hypothetical protein
MKKIIAVLIITVSSLSLFAQSEKYIGAMKSNIAAFDTSGANADLLPALSNTFERIAVAEKNQWLPYYYAAFAQVTFGFLNQDKSKTDLIADRAELLINKADSLSPGNSEISTIKSMIATCRMLVDPMSRYMKYGQVSGEELESAIKQDPSNPRPYYLKGQNLKYTPEQFGGGCRTAKKELSTAVEKFASFKPASELHPNWGSKRAQMILDECK